jgi:hypothetical protein
VNEVILVVSLDYVIRLVKGHYLSVPNGGLAGKIDPGADPTTAAFT